MGRIAITGAASFLGERFLRRLIREGQGDDLVVIDVAEPPLSEGAIRFRKIDLTEPASDQAMLDQLKADEVETLVHLAFFTGPRRDTTNAHELESIGTLAVLQWAPGAGVEAGVPSVAGTMAFHTFVLFQFFNILNARHDTRSVVHRDTLANRWLWVALAGVLLLQLAVSQVSVMRGLFDTVTITAGQWLVCVAIASSVLWIEEARKFFTRNVSSKKGS